MLLPVPSNLTASVAVSDKAASAQRFSSCSTNIFLPGTFPEPVMRLRATDLSARRVDNFGNMGNGSMSRGRAGRALKQVANCLAARTTKFAVSFWKELTAHKNSSQCPACFQAGFGSRNTQQIRGQSAQFRVSCPECGMVQARNSRLFFHGPRPRSKCANFWMRGLAYSAWSSSPAIRKLPLA